MSTTPVNIGLWGGNGHQIHHQLKTYPQAQLVAVGAFDEDTTATLQAAHPEAIVCDTLAEMTAVEAIELISLCSPMRCDQADDAIAVLSAGIHVYAEKPCATTEADLNRILAAAGESSATFHAMAGSVCENPYWAMRQLVAEGVVGEVVQVLAQKSYPFHPNRPTSERMDGGLIAQNGVHAMRFIEHISQLQAMDIQAIQTGLGEIRQGSDLKMACTLMGTLSNGGLFSVVANYLNQPGFGSWGNEMVRIFGTKGMLESVDGGLKTRLVVGDEDRGALDLSVTPPDWLALVLDNVRGENRFPFDLETELHPTRMVLKALENARSVILTS